MQRRFLLPFTSALAMMTCNTSAETLVYFGTYTRDGASKGIYRATLDETTGQVSTPVLAAEVSNPSFLAFHPKSTFAFSVSEISDHQGKKTGAVSSFAIQPDGSLTLINQQPSGGAGPCYVCVDPSGGTVLVANYGGGSCASYPIQQNGALGPMSSFHQHAGSSVDPKRQTGPHAHSIQAGPDGLRVYVPDLGLDRIQIYRLDSRAGTLTPNDPPFASTPAGGGPRHLAFHPNHRFAYANLEMASKVVAFSLNSDSGSLSILEEHSTLPSGFNGINTTAETLVHPSGRFLYVSNRGHDSIAAFAINPESGRLRFLECESSGGEIPRNFGIDPSGRFLLAAHQKTNNVVTLAIGPQTGLLSSTGHQLSLPSPVCVRFLRR